MSAKIQIRRDDSSGWATNPNLADGEIGFDTDLNQIKIGVGVSGTAWNSLPWLGGTLPTYASPSSTDLDDATNSVIGVYRFTSGSGLTNGPAAPIDIKAADGGASMLVLKFGSIVIQHLWTDGDGSQPQKSYRRLYDTAWRSWVAVGSWAVDSTEGVDSRFRKIDVTGGTAADPAIREIADPNTGIAWTAADTLVVATGGTAAVTIGPSQGATFSANVEINGNLDMTSGTISQLATPSAGTDAANKSYVDGTRVGQTAVIAVDGTTIHTQVSGTSTSGLFTIASAGIGNLRSVSGTWRGVACSSTGNYAQLDVNTGSASTTAVNGGTAPTNTFHATLVRIS